MIESNANGIVYYKQRCGEIENALARAVERAKACAQSTLSNMLSGNKAQKSWQKELNGREPNKDDFCVFVRINGYMTIALWQYRKLSKKDKSKIDREYDYKAIPEDRICRISS